LIINKTPSCNQTISHYSQYSFVDCLDTHRKWANRYKT